jgi:hypothetical protein
MRRRARLREVARWAGACACVVMLGVMVLTCWRVWLCGVTPRLMVSFEHGRMEVRTAEHDSQGQYWNPLIRGHIIGGIAPSGLKWLRWEFESYYDQYGRVVCIPLWAPALVLAIPTAILWRRDHMLTKRARAGRCPKCGYDRAGLAATIPCPECGTTPK